MLVKDIESGAVPVVVKPGRECGEPVIDGRESLFQGGGRIRGLGSGDQPGELGPDQQADAQRRPGGDQPEHDAAPTRRDLGGPLGGLLGGGRRFGSGFFGFFRHLTHSLGGVWINANKASWSGRAATAISPHWIASA